MFNCRSTDLRRDDHVGSVETTLGALVRPDQMVTNTFYTLRGPGKHRRAILLPVVGQIFPRVSQRRAVPGGGDVCTPPTLGAIEIYLLYWTTKKRTWKQNWIPVNSAKHRFQIGNSNVSGGTCPPPRRPVPPPPPRPPPPLSFFLFSFLVVLFIKERPSFWHSGVRFSLTILRAICRNISMIDEVHSRV